MLPKLIPTPQTVCGADTAPSPCRADSKQGTAGRFSMYVRIEVLCVGASLLCLSLTTAERGSAHLVYVVTEDIWLHKA